METQGIFNIPVGSRNLSEIFPEINWRDIDDYFVETLDLESRIIATSNLHSFPSTTPPSGELIRIHFANDLGTIDLLTFSSFQEEFETKSENKISAATFPTDKSVHVSNRFNVRTSEMWIAKTAAYNEDDMKWMKEASKSPLAWMELPASDGRSQAYYPIKINDSKMVVRQQEHRYIYEVQITFSLSANNITIRN